jgi:SPASM domain peptide maturase of grasp-with-spasm system
MSKYLILYSHCVPVRGKNQGAIYDFHRGRLLFIPNSMIDLIELMKEETFAASGRAVDSPVFFKEHIDYLLSNDLAFYTTTPRYFTPLPDQYFSPEHISNSIFEVDLSMAIYVPIFRELSDLLCKHLELRVANDDSTLNQLKRMLKHSHQTTIRSIDLHLLFNDEFNKQALLGLLTDFKKIRTITVHNTTECDLDHQNNIFFLKDNWEETQKKHFPKDVFIVNSKFFMESQQYNSYYHKKICITKEGTIKNSLLQNRGYGSYSQSNTLQDAINNKNFKELWYVKPDLIEGVKDSEARYATFYTQDIEIKEGKYFLTE